MHTHPLPIHIHLKIPRTVTKTRANPAHEVWQLQRLHQASDFYLSNDTKVVIYGLKLATQLEVPI